VTVEQVLLGIVMALVDQRNDVNITSTCKASGTEFHVIVAQSDVGKVIGKNGRTATSNRCLLTAMGVATRTRYEIKIAAKALGN
jgi:uncharacterized protein